MHDSSKHVQHHICVFELFQCVWQFYSWWWNAHVFGIWTERCKELKVSFQSDRPKWHFGILVKIIPQCPQSTVWQPGPFQAHHSSDHDSSFSDSVNKYKLKTSEWVRMKWMKHFICDYNRNINKIYYSEQFIKSPQSPDNSRTDVCDLKCKNHYRCPSTVFTFITPCNMQ